MGLPDFRTLFLGLILFLVPRIPCDTMLYWRSPNYLVATRVLGALWTWRPIVKVAMGCRPEPASVHSAHVLQQLQFFQFFFEVIYTSYRKKKDYTQLLQKNTLIYRTKKITRFDDFFVHVTFFT